MEKRDLICIGCPLGCPVSVTSDGGNITVTGHTCAKGEAYAKKEVTTPTRIVTSSVIVEGGALTRVSVKTKEDIPKGKIFDVMQEIKAVKMKAPIQLGDVIIGDCAGTGVSIIATKTVEAV